MTGGHLRNAASAAERWMSCPGSIRLEAQMPEQPSTDWQKEGTLAHRVFEAMLCTGNDTVAGLTFDSGEAGYPEGLITRAELDKVKDEMAEQINDAAAQIFDLQGETDGLFRSEWRGTLSSFGMPQCGGTMDVVMVRGRELWVIDLKYGWRPVEAVANPQIMLYGVQALSMLPDNGWHDIDHVVLGILQPKVAREMSIWRTTPIALVEWAMSGLKSAYERTFDPDAPCIPSEMACHWCPAAGVCKASHERMVERYNELRTYSPETIPLEQIAPFLEKVGEVEALAKSLWKRVAEYEASGRDVPGFKYVKSATRYKFEHEAEAQLAKIVPEEILYEKKIRSPAQLAKQGKAYETIANAHRSRPTKYKLVLESDKRPAVEVDRQLMFDSIEEGE